jgi:membrane-associated HD superfamily phosphohydrolase
MDPTYITIVVNGTNTTVLSEAATLLYNTLKLLPTFWLLVAIGIIVVTLDIILRLLKEENRKNKSQTQQANNSNISVDLKTLSAVKDSIFFSSFLILIITMAVLITFVAPANITIYQAVIFLILVLSIFGIAILFDGYSELKKVLPKKVRKIIKETITYSDGTTIEREKKYEY